MYFHICAYLFHICAFQLLLEAVCICPISIIQGLLDLPMWGSTLPVAILTHLSNNYDDDDDDDDDDGGDYDMMMMMMIMVVNMI